MTCKLTRRAANAAGGRGGRTIGTKRTLLVEILGLPVAADAASARPHDVATARALLGDRLDGLPRVGPSSATAPTAASPGSPSASGSSSTSKPCPAGQTGFVPLRPLYKIEHVFAQLGRWLRLSRCYEGSVASARAREGIMTTAACQVCGRPFEYVGRGWMPGVRAALVRRWQLLLVKPGCMGAAAGGRAGRTRRTHVAEQWGRSNRRHSPSLPAYLEPRWHRVRPNGPGISTECDRQLDPEHTELSYEPPDEDGRIAGAPACTLCHGRSTRKERA